MISPVKISPLFKGTGSSGPVSVLQPWYDSLSVKPSEGLWTDLKIMADGMNTDGDWGEIDLFPLFAALETDEQRLRPLKTTSGEDCVIEGTPNLSINGVDDPIITGNSGINVKWNPFDDGIKFTLNSAYVSGFGRTKISNIAFAPLLGAFQEFSLVRKSVQLMIDTSATSVTMGYDSFLNGSLSFTAINKTGLLNTNKTFGIGLNRIVSNQGYRLANTHSSVQTNNTTSFVTRDLGFYGRYYEDDITPLFFEGNFGGDNYFGRAMIAGSGLIDHNRVANRLNTFFLARGLPIDNY